MISDNDHTSHTSHDQQATDNNQCVNGAPSQSCCVQEELSACQAQVVEWKDKYLRVNADLDNVNRRAAKDRALSQHTAQVAIVLPLLTIVDDFERALEQQATTTDVHKLVEGITMIHTSLVKYLASVGVEPITEYGEFDPELHEALTSVVSDTHASGMVVSVLQKGYLFRGKPLRPAKVSVAQ